MSDYAGLDKAALDRWITREDDPADGVEERIEELRDKAADGHITHAEAEELRTLEDGPVEDDLTFEEIKAEDAERDAANYIGACEWFALCPNEATREREHPILGPVPICDSCNAKVDRLEAEELPEPENRPLTVPEADAARLAREEREESG